MAIAGVASRSAPGQAAKGHAELATLVYRSYDDGLRRFFRRHGVARDDVDDLLQDVYVRLLQAGDPEVIRSAQAFVYTTATNLLRDLYRRRRCRQSVESPAESHDLDVRADGFDPAQSAEYSQHLAHLLHALHRLKPATRQVFVGHRVGGQSYSQLARGLGISVSMVEKHMMAALAALSPLARHCHA
jgi:RNA polymerase sigma-70 factor (ECF subfamily)